MKVLVTANQKGGVGKTSTLVHLAFDFVERGLRVVVIDLDTQGNASFTLKEFASGIHASELWSVLDASRIKYFTEKIDASAMAVIECDAKLANVEKQDLNTMITNFRSNIQLLAEQGFDVCLIDTAPTLSNALVGALASADFVMSPIELEVYSIQGIKKLLTTFNQVKRMNKTLNFIGMLPSRVDGRNPRHIRHLKELRDTYPSLMMPVTIGLRSSIADALASCVPVWKIKKTAARKATQEVRALADHVYNKMEIAG